MTKTKPYGFMRWRDVLFIKGKIGGGGENICNLQCKKQQQLQTDNLSTFSIVIYYAANIVI